MEINKIYEGDAEGTLKTFKDDVFDSFVSDPPYGLKFMGKHWDYDIPKVSVFEEMYRTLKPGGYILIACGTRTQHRMAVNIEDAGFEIRDVISWLYGSGFPKSLDISKAIDKKFGAEREVLGKRTDGRYKNGFSDAAKKAMGAEVYNHTQGFQSEMGLITEPSTDEAKQWEGWGTALKPSNEAWILGRKPLNISQSSSKLSEYIVSLINKLKIQLCQLPSFVKIVERDLRLSQKGLKEVVDIAQWSAEESINTQEDLFVLMDTLQSLLMESTNWNIVLSWLNILEESYYLTNIYTTETNASLTTEFQILNSLEWESIFQNIILVKEMNQNGWNVNAYDAVSLFNVVKLKLKNIHTLFVQENASLVQIDEKQKSTLWTLARKPLSEKTVAENVLKHGTGGINIDACRIGTEEIKTKGGDKFDNLYGTYKTCEESFHNGRFPANVILDEFMGKELDKQTGILTSGDSKGFVGEYTGKIYGKYKKNQIPPNSLYADSGGASRFFYCAKADAGQRNKGLEKFGQQKTNDGRNKEIDNAFQRGSTLRNNHHPTVKPIDLMRYLVKLITPKGGLTCDPFCGSGTTLIGAKLELINYIGIEREKEYVEISEARVAAWNPDKYKEQTLFP